MKANANRKKYDVSFQEATTIGGDAPGATFADPDRSDAGSPKGAKRGSKASDMNNDESDDLRPEYDFDLSTATRGKYYQQYIDGRTVGP